MAFDRKCSTLAALKATSLNDYYLAMSNKQRFFLQLLLLTVTLGLLAWALSFAQIVPMHPHFAYILGYNVIITVLSFLILSKGMGKDKSPLEFNNHFMGNSTLRLLLTGAVLLIYIQFVKVEAFLFTGVFFCCYFIFTIFEIRYLLANLRQNYKRLGKTDGK